MQQIIVWAYIVVGWAIGQVTGSAFDDIHVVELEGCPAINIVAIGTLAGEMIGIERVGRWLMATNAVGRGIGILTIRVASDAFDGSVSTSEGVEAMVYILIQEGNR